MEKHKVNRENEQLRGRSTRQTVTNTSSWPTEIRFGHLQCFAKLFIKLATGTHAPSILSDVYYVNHIPQALRFHYKLLSSEVI